MRCVPLLLVCCLGACFPEASELQKQNLVSPSGRYYAKVPVIRPQGELPVWMVTIHDESGKMIYQDSESDFIAALNIYWCWADADVFWVYNSDDGAVYFWRHECGVWIKELWGRGDEKTTLLDIARPEQMKYENIYKKKTSGSR